MRTGGWSPRVLARALGQAREALRLRAFSLGRPGRRMSAAALLQYVNLKAEATPRKKYWKRGGGLCEGGLRRPDKRRQEQKQIDTRGYYRNGKKYSCEEETDAGGRIPASPQIEAAPEPAPSTAHWRGIATHTGI